MNIQYVYICCKVVNSKIKSVSTQKIWADSSISQAERRGKIAVLDDYFGEVVTR